ncbi:MAG: hypothetical protein ACR2NU_12660, partial [Aeoliella sp.]
DRLERRSSMIGRGKKREELLTAERIYLDALEIAPTQPRLAAQQLGHLITLFESSERTDPGNKEAVAKASRIEACLVLARRQQTRLEKKLAAQQETDLAALQERLRTAAAIYAEDPASAIALCTALVDLYQSKPWAAEMVEEAESLLTEWSRLDGSKTDQE